MALAVVTDVREHRRPATPEEIEAFEVDVLAGFVLARSSAGLADATIRHDVSQLDQIRLWFGHPVWEMTPEDADRYFGVELRNAPSGTRLARSQTLSIYFEFLELRYSVEIHVLTGHVVNSPIDEVNKPRGSKEAKLRIPPGAAEIATLFSGWAQDLGSCRKFAPAARNYAAARLMADIGLRVNETRHLDLTDIKWELGMFGKVHVRYGKGARGSGPRERMVPLVNNAGRTLAWYIEEVWSQLDDGDYQRAGAPLFASERMGATRCGRVGYETLRNGLAVATGNYLPSWQGRLTPHVLRHYCASQLYVDGMDIVAIQEMLGHRWLTTTMGYVHVQRTRVEQAWIDGQQRAAQRLKGLM